MGRKALRERQMGRGGRLGEEDGLAVVKDYGSAVEEARLARARVVLTERSERGRLLVAGADRGEFLQGQTTNHVLELEPGQGHHTAFLDGKGRVRADATLGVLPDSILLETEAVAREPLRVHLERLVVLEEVSIEDATEATACLGLHGPGALGAAAERLGFELPDPFPEHHVAMRVLDGRPVLCVARRLAGADAGVDLIVAAEAAAGLFERLAEALPPIGHDALEILRVEAGRPRFGVDFDSTTMPPEAGLDAIVRYDKGCFTGYEVMARIRTYGHVNRRLCGLDLGAAAPPPRGSEVRAGGKAIGHVTSAVRSPAAGRTLALAMVRRELAVTGQAVTVGDGLAEGRVKGLPFEPGAPGSTPEGGG